MISGALTAFQNKFTVQCISNQQLEHREFHFSMIESECAPRLVQTKDLKTFVSNGRSSPLHIRISDGIGAIIWRYIDTKASQTYRTENEWLDEKLKIKVLFSSSENPCFARMK
jgi:hypothetical protein